MVIWNSKINNKNLDEIITNSTTNIREEYSESEERDVQKMKTRKRSHE